MKTLSELSQTCVLIASFSQPAFVVTDGLAANCYKRANKALLFYDNKGTYYLYKYITKPDVYQFDNMSSALDRFLTFIEIVTKVD